MNTFIISINLVHQAVTLACTALSYLRFINGKLQLYINISKYFNIVENGNISYLREWKCNDNDSHALNCAFFFIIIATAQNK